MTKPANDMRVRAAVWLDEYTEGDWTGAITDALVSFVSDAVAQAVKELRESLGPGTPERIFVGLMDECEKRGIGSRYAARHVVSQVMQHVDQQAEEIAQLRANQRELVTKFQEQRKLLNKYEQAHGFHETVEARAAAYHDKGCTFVQAAVVAERERLSLQMDHHVDECGCGVHKALRAPRKTLDSSVPPAYSGRDSSRGGRDDAIEGDERVSQTPGGLQP